MGKLKLAHIIKGDRALWAITIALAVFSLLPVYSASSTIAFASRGGDTLPMLLKHGFHLIISLLLLIGAHRIPYKSYAPIASLMYPIVVVLLLYTLVNGHSVANASRWIRIPGSSLTFQTSALASVVLMMYLSRNLAKAKAEVLSSLKLSFIPLLLPIFLICGLILPANFSTAALIFIVAISLLFIGGYAIKNLFIICGSGVAALALFIVVILAIPNSNSRVSTWKTRIESFYKGDVSENYQVHKAKMAIAEGLVIGKGPGKSIQKNFLPQSDSDFIYAVIVEEFGGIGGFLILLFYSSFLVRVLNIARKSGSKFGMYLVSGIGLMICIQAFINMGVAVNLIPVTGQTLPLISAGGSSIWMTCLAIGIMLSVSVGLAKNKETQPEEESNNPETPSHVPA